MDESQMMKGILAGCVLAIINSQETYGYDIIIKLDDYGFHNIIEGTLYPVLSRLEKKNLIVCRKGKSPLGPVRKYYSITEEGQEELNKFKIMYLDITKTADKILLGGERAWIEN